MAWAIFFGTVLVTFANFADFLLGSTGSQKVRERMLALYVLVDDDWHKLYQLPAEFVCRFLDNIFSTSGARLFLNIFTYSTVSVAAISAIYYAFTVFILAVPTPVLGALVEYLFHVSGNFPADVLAWVTMRFLFRRIARSGPGFASLLLGLAFSAAGLCCFISFKIASSLEGFVLSLPHSTFEQALIHETLTDKLRDAVSSGSIGYEGALPIFLSIQLIVAVPLVLMVLGSTASVVVSLLRPILRPTLMLLLERIEASGKHTLTIASLVIGSVISLLAALPGR